MVQVLTSLQPPLKRNVTGQRVDKVDRRLMLVHRCRHCGWLDFVEEGDLLPKRTWCWPDCGEELVEMSDNELGRSAPNK